MTDAGREEPLLDWSWVGRNLDVLGELLTDHLVMSVVPVVAGLAIAVPTGLACARWPRVYQPVLAVTSLLYALPGIALFVVLVAFTGLTRTTVIIPLTLYTLAVLVPAVAEGLRAVSDHVRQSAAAMGYRPLRRLLQVELPIAVPVVMGGLRVAAVSNISLVSVGALIGVGGLGQLFTRGAQLDFATPIIVGIVLTVVLALLADGLLLAAQRLFTPWARAERASR